LKQKADGISKSSEVRMPVIALVGNPNTGKSTVFNSLCGTRQKVGNYPGVTVEKRSGRALLPKSLVEIVDLPGIYSLKAISPDEEVAADAIMGRIKGEKRPDMILCVIDATNIKRNLYLYSQLAETKLPMVVALTMTDLLKREGIEIDIQEMEKFLGVPVIRVVASDRETLDDLKNELSHYLESPVVPSIDLDFPEALEKISSELSRELEKYYPISSFEARNLLFFSKDPILHFFENNPDSMKAVAASREAAKEKGFISPAVIPAKRYEWADKCVARVEKRNFEKPESHSQRIDKILTHKFFGFVLFTGLMYGVFQSIYSWASPIMDLIENGFSLLGDTVGAMLASQPVLQSLVVDGVIGGVGAVIIFVPQIAILFAFIAVLEDSGYLARAAFLMDKLLGWTGLNGRSFIPMLSGFACAVPSIMSTRVIPDFRVRLATIMVIPLMSCSARLPVYLLFLGAFIEPLYGVGWAVLALFLMHTIGPLIALPIAYVLNRNIIKSQAAPFLLEMPSYRLPNLYNVLFRVYEAVSKFIVRAGTIIFAMSIIIWALSYFPHSKTVEDSIRSEYSEKLKHAENMDATLSLNREMENRIAGEYLEQSYLGKSGKMIQPLFAPLGFDWKISVGILGAFPAREVIISTLGIIYNVGDSVSEESADLKNIMSQEKNRDGSPVFTAPVVMSLLVFFALCSQCMSTLATVKKELHSWKWAVFQFVYMTGLAYVLALIVYQVSNLFF